jgi:hypothetical protein
LTHARASCEKTVTRSACRSSPSRSSCSLLGRPGEVVTRDEMRQVLWPGDTFVDFEVGLNSAIKRLRDALNDSADQPRFVQTLPRRGYRFIEDTGIAEPLAHPVDDHPPFLQQGDPGQFVGEVERARLAGHVRGSGAVDRDRPRVVIAATPEVRGVHETRSITSGRERS